MESKGLRWSDAEVECLLEIWADENIQTELEQTHKNSEIFGKVRDYLLVRGYRRTIEQCRDKVKKLRVQYLKVRHRKCVEKEKFQWFDAVDKIMGLKPSSEPAGPESSVGTQAAVFPENPNPNPAGAEDRGPETPLSNTSLTADESHSDDWTQAETAETSDTSICTTSTSAPDRRPPALNKKRKMKTDVSDIMEAFMDMQKKQHDEFMQGERLRHRQQMKMFGNWMKTQVEMEERRQRDANRMFQQLFASLQRNARSHPQYHHHHPTSPSKQQTASPSDDEKNIIIKVEPQEYSSSLDQDPPDIKEEQVEVWTGQEGEQLQGPEEADMKITFSPVPVKSEDEEDKPQSAQLLQRQTEQMETEADVDKCGGSDAARNSHPDSDEETSGCSEPDTDDSDDWKETSEPQSGLNGVKMNPCRKKKDCVSSVVWYTSSKPYSCFKCGKEFVDKRSMQRHVTSHEDEKPLSCSVCEKHFRGRTELVKHMRTHTGEKPFTCSVCGYRFSRSESLNRHMRCHTGEKPFSCSFCLKRFRCRQYIAEHMRTHTGEKPFDCSSCGKGFSTKSKLTHHMRVHTGEKLTDS